MQLSRSRAQPAVRPCAGWNWERAPLPARQPPVAWASRSASCSARARAIESSHRTWRLPGRGSMCRAAVRRRRGADRVPPSSPATGLSRVAPLGPGHARSFAPAQLAAAPVHQLVPPVPLLVSIGGGEPHRQGDYGRLTPVPNTATRRGLGQTALGPKWARLATRGHPSGMPSGPPPGESGCIWRRSG